MAEEEEDPAETVLRLGKENAALRAKLKKPPPAPFKRKPLQPRDPKAQDRFVRTYDGR